MWSGPFYVTKVEALDQSEGLGGFVFRSYNGVNTSSVELLMANFFEDTIIDFIVNVYVDGIPNNFISGNLTENSVLLHT